MFAVCLYLELLFFFLQRQQNPLYVASLNGHAEICELLLEKGAAVNAQEEVSRNLFLL